MTTLVFWVGCDSHGPTSLYAASDSRASDGSGRVWDRCRKVFAFAQAPAVVGYAGPILAISQALSHFKDRFDLPEADLECLPERLVSVLEDAIGSYPDRMPAASVVLAIRRSARLARDVRFAAWEASIVDGTVRLVELNTPTKASDAFAVRGSGTVDTQETVKRWREADVSGRTSRSVFSGFCDALRSGRDRASGGAPQLVGMYRKGPAKTFGVVYAGAPYYLGAPCPPQEAPGNTLWFNEIFENVDPATLKRADGAQRHARPKQLGDLA